MEIHIRQVRPEDLEQCLRVEQESFPPEEAAPKESIALRIKHFPQGFLVAERDGEVVGMINSGATDQDDIADEAFKALEGHDPDGKYLAVFSLSVLPAHRGEGLGRMLLTTFQDLAAGQKREGVLLLCKEHLAGFYESCGFELRGPSACSHGGAAWLEMGWLV